MAIDACAVWGDSDTDALSTSPPSSPARRNRGALELKFRLREDRKKVLRISAAKYRSIEDHESVLRRSVLIRNTLRRVQREAREEKLARHRAAALSGGATNVSPSYLSASRPRSPSPIEDDVQVSDVLSLCAPHTPHVNLTGLDDDYDEDDEHTQPAAKRPRLYDDDKEDERSCLDRLEERLEEDVKMEAHQRNSLEEHQRNSMEVDDAQEILRDLYETCTQDPLPTHLSPSSTSVSSVSSVSTTTTTSTSNSYNSSILFQRSDTGSGIPPYTPAITTASLTTGGGSLGVNSNNTTSSSTSSSSYSLNTTSYNTAVNHHMNTSTNTTTSFDWSSRHHHHHHHQQYPCGHSSLLGNDLQSVVFHSLIASLES
ncbi:uncharacterized protein LOC143020046 isoform X2 [Oratosquilla oratoria]